MVRRYLAISGVALCIFTGVVIKHIAVDVDHVVVTDAGTPDVPPPMLTLSLPCEPLYRYQPDRANAVFNASLPSTSVGLNDFGVLGVQAIGSGASNPTLQSCAGAMSGYTCANFDGNDRYLVSQSIVQNQKAILAAVVRPELNSWDIVSDTLNSGVKHWFGFKPSGNATVQAPTDLSSSNNVAANDWSFICTEVDGAASVIHLNGTTSSGNAGANAPIPLNGATAGFSIGAIATNQFHLHGDLLEYVVFDGGTCGKSCADLEAEYFAHKYPEIGLTQGTANEVDCTRSDPLNLCPADGECRVVVVGDSIQQGSNPGAPGASGSPCAIASVSKPCTQNGATSGVCPCNGTEARNGVVDTMIEGFAKNDCYSRMNRAQSGSRTDGWKAAQWDPISASVVADVGIIGGANNDWSTPSITTCANVQAIANDMLASGIPKVLILGGHPQGDNNDHIASDETKRVAENACIAAYAAATANVEFQTFDGTVVDGGPGANGPSMAIAADWGDGLHFSNDAGEDLAASVIAPYFQ